MKTKIITALLLGASALAAAPRVSFSIGVGLGPGYYAPAPVYVAPPPPPVYYAPAPAYVAPAPVYAGPPVAYADGYYRGPRGYDHRWDHRDHRDYYRHDERRDGWHR